MHLHFKSLAAGLGMAVALGLATAAQGQTLTNPQNTAVFNYPNNTSYAANQGLTMLTRNDPPTLGDHIQDVNQWFLFYRTDSGTNQSVGTLFRRFSSAVDTNGDGLPDQSTVTYANDPTSLTPSLVVAVTSRLIGSGTTTNASYQSTIVRTISVRPNFSTPTDVHLFSLTNLGLTQVESPAAGYTQDPGPTFAQQVGRNIRVWQNNPNGQLVTDSRTDSDALNMPSKYEIATNASSIAALITKLTTTNSDLASTFSGSTGPVIPGDVGGPNGKASIAYALQYDILGATNATYFTNETLTVTPEPASLALLAIGGSMMLLRRRRA